MLNLLQRSVFTGLLVICLVPTLSLAQTGNFGIGTTTPQQKLHVAGKARIDDLAPTANAPSVILQADNNGVVRGVSGASDNQILQWNNSTGEWELATPPGASSTADLVNSDGTMTIANGANAIIGTSPVDIGLAQQGATNGQVLEWNGSAWVPAADENTTYSAGAGINISAGNVIELVTTTNAPITGDGTGASPIALQNGTANGQVLQWDGSSWSATLLQTDQELTGLGTSTAPLDLAQQSATNGQVLKWNGSNWVPGNDNVGSVSSTDLTTNTASNNVLTIVNGTGTVLASGGTQVNLAPGNNPNDALLWNNSTNQWEITAIPGATAGDLTSGTTVLTVTNGTGAINNPGGADLNLQNGSADNDILSWNAGTGQWEITQPAATATSDLVNNDGNINVGNGAGVVVGNTNASVDLAQNGATDGQVLKWDNSTSQWVPMDDDNTTYSAGDGINITGANAIELAANTTAPLMGDGTSGNPIDFQDGTSNGQVWQWDGTAWTLVNASTFGDNWGSQVAQTTVEIAGDGTGASPLGIAQQSATDGQVLTWNNTAGQWEPQNAPGGGTGDLTASSNISGVVSVSNGTGAINNPGGTSVDFANGSADGDVISWDAGAGSWTISAPSGGGTVNTNSPLTGDGSAGSPIDLQYENALEMVSNTLRWGGPLVDSTTVDQAGYDIYFTGAGQIGVNNSTPPGGARFFAEGDATFPTAIFGRTAQAGVPASSGVNTNGAGPAVGVLGITQAGAEGGVQGQTNSTDNAASGVSGFANPTSGTTYGVFGQTFSTATDAAGVRGVASAATGDVYGVIGEISTSTPGAAGVRGFSSSGTGMQTRGVEGESDANSNGAAGVIGFADGGTANTSGVIGQSVSTGNGAEGVLGQYIPGGSPGGTGGGAGVTGLTNANGGAGAGVTPAGVTGQNVNSTAGIVHGVEGLIATTTNGAAGVFGEGSFPAWGVFANGDVGASGTKPFHIDHPDKPATHYLNHFAMEGPRPYNVYMGKITTDSEGYATVELPDYFDSMNTNFHYNLTVIGSFAQAIVKEEINKESFVIQTEEPNVKVSWTVMAERDDPYMQQYDRKTVEPKTGQAKGRYLQPQLYDQPPSKAIHMSRPRKMQQLKRSKQQQPAPTPNRIQQPGQGR